MPAHLMYDGENDRLFDDYASVAQRCGVYTAQDYASIMEHLIAFWDIEHLTGDFHYCKPHIVVASFGYHLQTL